MASNEQNPYFNLEIVRENFKLSKNVKNDIELQFYLKSLEELNRSELEGETAILRNFLSSPNVGQHFSSVKKMIEYERRQHLLTKEGYISGSRTLLRLHRCFEFIIAFLKGLIDLGEREETSTVCHNAYIATLANHHSPLITVAANLAMCSLPRKHELLAKVCGSEESIRKAEEILPETIALGSEVYNIIQNMYKKKNLLSLP